MFPTLACFWMINSLLAQAYQLHSSPYTKYSYSASGSMPAFYNNNPAGIQHDGRFSTVLEKYLNRTEPEKIESYKEKNYGDACQKSSDCNRTSRLICNIEGRCVCKFGGSSIFDEDLSICATRLGHICTTHNGQHFCTKNAECDPIKKVCACIPGTQKVGGKCEPDQEPEEDLDYFDSGTTEQDQKISSTTLKSLLDFERESDSIAQQKSTSVNDYDNGGDDEELFSRGDEDTALIPPSIATTQQLEKFEYQMESDTTSGGDIVSTPAFPAHYSDPAPTTFQTSSSDNSNSNNEDSIVRPPFLPVPLLEIPTPIQAPPTTEYGVNYAIPEPPTFRGESVESVIRMPETTPSYQQYQGVSERELPVHEVPGQFEAADIPWPWPIENVEESSPYPTIKEKVKLGEMCNNQNNGESSCGVNAVCQEIGNSSDFVCVCKGSFIGKAESDTDCIEEQMTEKDDIFHTNKDHMDDNTNINVITPAVVSPLDQNTILELDATKPLREFLLVGESCVPPSSEGIEKNSLKNPEISLSICVQDAECVLVTSLFQEFNICQCRQGFSSTANGKCTNYRATSSASSRMLLSREIQLTWLGFNSLCIISYNFFL